MFLIDLANPHRFQKLARVMILLLAIAPMLPFGIGLLLGFCAPADYQQGEMVRVMYLHVPFAWLSLGAYTLMAVAALGTLVWRIHLLTSRGMSCFGDVCIIYVFLLLRTARRGEIWILAQMPHSSWHLMPRPRS